ncbi:AraC family transcriptional regulator [Reticulibacter mediterranei]|uniref:AraC family transcriptional regulator n=1 Tax=Reticulibacter mediterranei TaxID=2778369 RepID=A0A8J3IJU3_9CHLR|nr:helix-turn-helix domain-containing protein [Reticulibacter mediterranei]GHO90906.1 AraC family transcriptional regulator [Reticulibacter mediterranei]
MFSCQFLLYPKIMKPFDHANPTIDVETLGFATNKQQPGLMQRPHRHNEVELNYLERGAIVYLSGGKRIEIHAGQVAIFWAAIPHQMIHIEEDALFYWITIPFATFLQWRLPDMFAQHVIRGQFVLCATQPQITSPLHLFRQWQIDLQQKESTEYQRIVQLEIEALLRRLALSDSIAPITYEAITGSSVVEELNKVEKIACFIADHYTEPLHIEDIAQVVHLHPNYAMTLFRKHLGLSIIDYMTQYRLAHAQRLLIISNTNASAIALEAGFGSVSRFYTTFKHAYGQAPGAYRATWTTLQKPKNN